MVGSSSCYPTRIRSVVVVESTEDGDSRVVASV